MNGLDWSILIAYFAGLVGWSAWLGRGQVSEEDYYLAGRRLSWWSVGLSTMATQSSAISFIGIPAYVALREGGGLNWLQYELAVPLAMIAAAALLVPLLRRLRLVSVYEYLERRFDRGTRRAVAGVFLLSRGLATGVALYAAAILLSACLGLPLVATILLLALVTVFYDTLGGMRAVVASDVLQFGLLLGGLVAGCLYALEEVGGLAEAMTLFPADRWQVIGPGSGLGDGASAPFWGYLFGGLLLYLSYYGVDQSQVQRELSARSETDSRRSLVLNGLCRFPLTLLYCLLGVCVSAVFSQDPALRAAVAARPSPDFLVPEFILAHLPQGLRALLVAAILAAAMSSLDSAINSLSAVTLRDFFPSAAGAGAARWVTAGWGATVTAAALFFATEQGVMTVVEQINRIGSAFYGPVLGVFLAGVLLPRAGERAAVTGLIAGVGLNLALFFGAPGVFWAWWNVTGCSATLAVISAFSAIAPRRASGRELWLSPREIARRERPHASAHLSLVAWFVVILGVCRLASRFGGGP